VEFHLTGQPGERGRFVKAFEDFCRLNHVPDSARQAADLALEEHLTNVLSYGFKSGEERWISIRLSVNGNALIAKVADRGMAYDPLSAPLADPNIPLEEKSIGGLGVYLMVQSMDQLTYSREEGMNILRMKKAFAA
jgi:serine/threonine-protein kinase RsbW